MDKLDEMIREALEGEDRALLAQTEELGFFSLALSQFRGKLGWIAWLLMAVQTTMFLAGVWCAVRFFGTDEVIPALRWGLATTVLWMLATNIKLSMMPQMQADRVIRELKRVELMLAARR